jgi:hypothetical protein
MIIENRSSSVICCSTSRARTSAADSSAATAVPVLLAGVLLYHAWLDKRAGRPSSRGQPPGAGGAAPWRLAPADSPGQLSPVNRDPGQAAEAALIGRPRPALPSWRPPHRWRPLGHWYAVGCPDH